MSISGALGVWRKVMGVGNTVPPPPFYTQQELDEMAAAAQANRAMYPNGLLGTAQNWMGLPTSDPGVAGQTWNNHGVVEVSQGPLSNAHNQAMQHYQAQLAGQVPPQNLGLATQAAAAAQQNQLAAAQQWAAMQGQIWPQNTPSGPAPLVQMSVKHEKARRQTEKLVDLLPVSIASHIDTCVFYEKGKDNPACFVLRFDNGRELAFEDIDVFPSDEHIARIALECP